MPDAPFVWNSACRSHVGMVRDLNEDACLELTAKGLWAVADGMGGHSVGDVASQMVVEALRQVPQPSSLGGFVNDVRRELLQVNQQLREEAHRRGASIIGSTVATLLTYQRHCVYLWAGDSRVYRLRAGQLSQLSRDHSQVEKLIEQGLITRDQAHDHPSSNAITRAVGAEDSLALDDEMITVKDGDVYLLCSDGLHNEVSDDEIAVELLRGNCQQACERLVSLVLSRGGRDNVTVLVVRADDRLEPHATVINPQTP